MTKPELIHKLRMINFNDLADKIKANEIKTLKQVDIYLSKESNIDKNFDYKRYSDAWVLAKNSILPIN